MGMRQVKVSFPLTRLGLWPTGIPAERKYLIIKRYVNHELQDELFEHVGMLKEKGSVTSSGSTKGTTSSRITAYDQVKTLGCV